MHQVQSLPHRLPERHRPATGEVLEWSLREGGEPREHIRPASPALHRPREEPDAVLPPPGGSDVAGVPEADHHSPQRSVQPAQLSRQRQHQLGVVQRHHAAGQ